MPTSSPYSRPSGEPALIPSFVCYADILGFSELSRAAVKAGLGEQFLQKLRTVLTEAYEQVRTRAGDGIFSVKVFTDNIVVGHPAPENGFDFGEAEFGTMLWVFSSFQMTLATNGFLVRGGIALGDHYMDDDIVFGPALLDAVALDTDGGPPRLALSPEAVEAVRHHLGFYGDDARFAPHYNDLLMDADGGVFLNYLNLWFSAIPDYGVFFDLVEKHRETIRAGLKQYAGRPGIRSKYEWAARYHNFVCHDFAERHPMPSAFDEGDELWALVAKDAQRLKDDFIIEDDPSLVAPTRITLAPIRPGALSANVSETATPTKFSVEGRAWTSR
jgi:hypothetical protein